MWGIITFAHVLVSVLMIMVILLQTGKGAEIGAAFGGGYSQTLFGSSGPVGFLNKLTTVVATVFMLTSLLLALWAGRVPTTKSLVDTVPQQQQEAPVVPGPVPGGK
jgi:preprotein translocase subunit SecG